jgi:hypothetical protein
MHGIYGQIEEDGGQNSAMNPACYYNTTWLTGRKFEMSVNADRIVFFTKYTGKFRWLTCKETLNPYGVKGLSHIQENHACEPLLMKVPVHFFDELHHCSAMLYLCQNLHCFLGNNQHSISLPRIPIIMIFSKSLRTMSSRLNGMTGTSQQGIIPDFSVDNMQVGFSAGGR